MRLKPPPMGVWLVLLLVIQAGVLYLFRAFIVDDTWIFMRYARNFASGYGPVFNPGQPVEGYTSFLWVVTLGGCMKLGWDGLTCARVIGGICALGTTGVTYLLGRKVTPGRGYLSLIAPASVAVSVPLAAWAMSGMDTLLFTFLVTLTLYSHLQCAQRSRRYLTVVGWIGGLAALSRPEGWLFMGHRMWQPTRHGRRADAVAYLLPFVMVVLPHLLWRYQYYGYWFPNSFYIKALLTKEAGVLYTWQFLHFHGGLALVALCALPVALAHRKEAWTLVAASVALWVLYVARLGDWMPLFRFYVPVLPLFGVLAQAGVVEVREVLKRVRLDPFGVRLFLALLGLAVVWSTVCRLYTYRSVMRNGTDFTLKLARNYDDEPVLKIHWRLSMPVLFPISQSYRP